MRLTLATTLKNRGRTTAKDARLVNAFVDSKGRVAKRPSLVQSFETIAVGPGGGIFTWTTPTTETVIAISNDNLIDALTSSPYKLVFTIGPPTGKINTAFSPSVVVTAKDAFGNTKTSFTGDVTIALAANPSGGTLSGTLTATAVLGVATFANLKLNRVGGGYKIKATSGRLKPVTSAAFKVISSLSFTQQPLGDPPDTIFDTPVEVSIVDVGSVVVPAYVGSVTIAIGQNGGIAAPGILSGTLTKATVSGVATFNDLKIDQEGTYTLIATASAGGLIQQESNSFDIADQTHTLVAVDLTGSNFGQWGFDSLAVLGSITPTLLNGRIILALFSDVAPIFASKTELRIAGTLAQNFFTSVTINGKTLLSANADSFLPGADTTWLWGPTLSTPALELIPSAGTFPVTFA